jgi:hypothetical protein
MSLHKAFQATGSGLKTIYVPPQGFLGYGLRYSYGLAYFSAPSLA